MSDKARRIIELEYELKKALKSEFGGRYEIMLSSETGGKKVMGLHADVAVATAVPNSNEVKNRLAELFGTYYADVMGVKHEGVMQDGLSGVCYRQFAVMFFEHPKL